MRIGGNIKATVQQKVRDGAMNAIGERLSGWNEIARLQGWLDLQNGDSRYNYNTKLQESTHIFLCDFTPIDRRTDDKRLVIDGAAYDILLIDDPMELHQHLEIYLKKVI